MIRIGIDPPSPGPHFGDPSADPLAARLFPPLPGTVKWGLERTERILAGLGDPHRAYPVLHVGGTNGKGSVARIWAGVLRSAGLRTGLYTSPHLVSFRERILVDGFPVPDRLMEEWSDDLRPLLVRESPSYFEAATALAFLAFARAEVEVAVVEVGMGGRLDATNVVSPVLTAITNVGWDHVEILGPELPDIAREKAGILKPGIPAYTAADDRQVLRVLAQEAAALGAGLRHVPFPEGARTTLDGSRFKVTSPRWGEMELASPLVGEHQVRNLALAVRALEALPPRIPLSAVAVREGVLRTRIPGRFQQEEIDGTRWIFDAAHNAEGVRALVHTLSLVSPPGPIVALVGILADKNWGEMLETLRPRVDSLVLTIPDSAPPGRRWDPAAAAARLGSRKVRAVPGFAEAVEGVRSAARNGGTVLVTGSVHTVGDALFRLDRIPVEALPTDFDCG